MARPAMAKWRRAIYAALEQGPHGDRSSRIVSGSLVALILVNLVAVILESVPALDRDYHLTFMAIELVSLVVFTAEYLLRIFVAPEHEPYKHLPGLRCRLRYAGSVAGIVDLLAVLPFWFGLLLPEEWRVVLVFRLFRFIKLARYSPGMHSLLDALYKERRALGGCLLILASATVVAAALMHLIERNVQPEKFGTIPDAMWWAIVTLGTIGYGDVVPVTPLGKALAAITIFAGLIMIALPVGIIATAFAEQIHRRDFIVTWGMVARVPLFSGLAAGEIADVMELLRAETEEAGAVIARRGDPAHSMYFIASGEVEFVTGGETRRLGVGHFFGEIAALRQARRSATVRARERTRLLVLDAKDLRALMKRQPRIAKRLHETVRDRIGHDLLTPEGDIIAEELEGEETARKPRQGPAAD